MRTDEIGIILILLGALITIVGSIILTITPSLNPSQSTKSNIKVFVGGFIGPIPFGFSNNKNLLIIGIALTIFIYILFITLHK